MIKSLLLRGCICLLTLPYFQGGLRIAREKEKVRAHGILLLNLRFIAFKRAEANS
jgi:hypothetical protein